MIYLDNAATTYPKPEEVYNAMDNFYRKYGVSFGRGSYDLASKVSNLVDECRKRVANVLGVNSNKTVIFTPSATISINTILKGLDWSKRDNVYYSPFEHNATLRTLYALEKEYDLNLIQVPIDRSSIYYNLVELERLYKQFPPKIIVVSHVSNVCGVIAPVEKIAKITHEYHGFILVDGSQAAGIIKINQQDIDYYVWSGHKSLYGPFGIAGFIIDNEAPIPDPLIHGGTGIASELKDMPEDLPLRLEAGSINIQAIAGLNAALKWIETVGHDTIFNHEKAIGLRLIEILKQFIGVNLYIPEDINNHFSIVSASFSGFLPHEIGKILNEEFNIAVRTGLHCAPLIHEFLEQYLMVLSVLVPVSLIPKMIYFN